MQDLQTNNNIGSQANPVVLARLITSRKQLDSYKPNKGGWWKKITWRISLFRFFCGISPATKKFIWAPYWSGLVHVTLFFTPFRHPNEPSCTEQPQYMRARLNLFLPLPHLAQKNKHLLFNNIQPMYWPLPVHPPPKMVLLYWMPRVQNAVKQTAWWGARKGPVSPPHPP